MRGNVLGFDAGRNTGAISGRDGRRYEFTALDWQGRGRPRHGDLVDFLAEGNRATQIYLVEPEYVAPSFGRFYFTPDGRISRAQYWLRFFLPVLALGIVVNLLALAGGALRFLPPLFQLLVLWPGIAMLIKRIHDRNKSGWLVWALYGPVIAAIPFMIGALVAGIGGAKGTAGGMGVMAGMLWLIAAGVGIWFFIEFGCLRGTIGPNFYGSDPVTRG